MSDIGKDGSLAGPNDVRTSRSALWSVVGDIATAFETDQIALSPQLSERADGLARLLQLHHTFLEQEQLRVCALSLACCSCTTSCAPPLRTPSAVSPLYLTLTLVLVCLHRLRAAQVGLMQERNVYLSRISEILEGFEEHSASIESSTDAEALRKILQELLVQEPPASRR